MLNNCIALARPEAQSIIVVLVSASMMDFKVPWIPLCAELPWLVIVNNQNWQLPGIYLGSWKPRQQSSQPRVNLLLCRASRVIMLEIKKACQPKVGDIFTICFEFELCPLLAITTQWMATLLPPPSFLLLLHLNCLPLLLSSGQTPFPTLWLRILQPASIENSCQARQYIFKLPGAASLLWLTILLPSKIVARQYECKTFPFGFIMFVLWQIWHQFWSCLCLVSINIFDHFDREI